MQAITIAPAAAANRTRIAAIAQLCVAFVLILAVIWSPDRLERPLSLLTTLFIAGSIWASYDGRRTLGLRMKHLADCAWVPVVSLGLAILAAEIAFYTHTLQPSSPFRLYVHEFWAYAVWSFVQQLVLQGFFLARFCRLLPNARMAAVATAIMFSLAHLPNPVLTVLSLVWGLIACLVFLRHHNIFPLAVAHAILGICVAVSLPGPIIRGMHVGAGYLTYSPPPAPASPGAVAAPLRRLHG